MSPLVHKIVLGLMSPLIRHTFLELVSLEIGNLNS